MFSSNLTLKATMMAQKVKEKEDNRMAARYIRIRALLDEAEKAINGSNITRSLKNKLMAKHVKARKALDTGLNVEEVIEVMTLIVAIINQEIRQDKDAIETTTMEMRRNLDTFYNYSFDKFLEREQLPREYPSETGYSTGKPRSQSRGRSRVNSRLNWKRSPSEGSLRAQTPESTSRNSDRSSPVTQSNAVTVKEQNIRGASKISEEVQEVIEEDKLLLLSDNEEMETFKRDITSAGIESLEVDDDDDAEVEQDPADKHSLETCYSCRRWMFRHKFLSPVQAL